MGAAGAGDLRSMRRLLSEGAGVAARTGRAAPPSWPPPALTRAAQALLDAGADADAEDGTQQVLVLHRDERGRRRPTTARAGACRGADPHAKNSFNGTGLIRAAHRGHIGIVDRLLGAGVDVDHVNRLGWTALLEPVILGDGGPRYTRTARLLLDEGADPLLPDRNGATPASHAECRGHTALADMLRTSQDGA